MSESFDTMPADLAIRTFQPADAAGIVALVRQIYGESYYPTDLYDVDKIIALNQGGQLSSIVTVGPAGEIIGHYALERPEHGAIAEASDAMVHPEYRHHHLLERMRVLLRKRGEELGLIALVGYPVTNHLFTQKAEDHFGAKPCGVALGLWPRSFHNMPQPLAQRMSFIIYVRFLRPPARVRQVETRHAEIIQRTLRQFGLEVETIPGGPAAADHGSLAVQCEPAVQTGLIHVERIGRDSLEAIRQATGKLCKEGALAVELELPLADPAIADLTHAAERLGYFFCGVGPAFGNAAQEGNGEASSGDCLLMQLLREDLDASLVQVEQPFAKELLDYVDGQRRACGAAP